MYITDIYKEVCEAYNGDDSHFLRDVWMRENDFCEIVEEGEEVIEHKSSYQDIIFRMHSDGRTFRYTILRDNCGYWGEGETYWDETEVEEVEKKEVVVTKWVRVGC